MLIFHPDLWAKEPILKLRPSENSLSWSWAILIRILRKIDHYFRLTSFFDGSHCIVRRFCTCSVLTFLFCLVLSKMAASFDKWLHMVILSSHCLSRYEQQYLGKFFWLRRILDLLKASDSLVDIGRKMLDSFDKCINFIQSTKFLNDLWE